MKDQILHLIPNSKYTNEFVWTCFLQVYSSVRENWLPIVLYAMKNFKRNRWLTPFVQNKFSCFPLQASTDFPLSKGLITLILYADKIKVIRPDISCPDISWLLKEDQGLIPPSSYRPLWSFFEQESSLSISAPSAPRTLSDTL